MEWLFVGPTKLAGIGQVTYKYAQLVNGDYVEYGQAPPKKTYDRGFAFVLPIQTHLDMVAQYASICKKMNYMTVCETEPVSPAYGLLERYPEIYCPSEFSRQILEKQFPTVRWKLLRHWVGSVGPRPPPAPSPYVFYTIGNVADPRKNIRGLIDAYLRCNFGNAAHLVLKATCMHPIDWKVPGVTVINGLLSDEDLEKIHGSSHCYVNCSHSEGVGMGAVEAALRSKPVIASDYGGLCEYVKTPWVVPCTKGPVGIDDFLFTRDLVWGYPSGPELQRCLRDCFEKKVLTWDHEHTRQIMFNLKNDCFWQD